MVRFRGFFLYPRGEVPYGNCCGEWGALLFIISRCSRYVNIDSLANNRFVTHLAKMIRGVEDPVIAVERLFEQFTNGG